MAENGAPPGSSVGFIALERRSPTKEETAEYVQRGKAAPSIIVPNWIWYELSLTMLPCNVDCQGVVSEKAVDLERLEARFGMLDRLVTSGVISRKSAAVFGLPGAEPRAILRVTTGKVLIPGVGYRLRRVANAPEAC